VTKTEKGRGRGGRARAPAAGFTAVEGVIVLAIAALGAALGTVAFRRWIESARTAEAVAMLTEIRNQEGAFKAGGGRFLALHGDARPDGAAPDESPGGFYPLPADSPELASARRPTRVDDPARLPAAWRALGLRPWRAELYCTYLVNAGSDGEPPRDLRFGSALLRGAAPGPWFYALAACNLGSGNAHYPDGMAVFGISSLSPEIRKFDE
jgi:hypothetical protein